MAFSDQPQFGITMFPTDYSMQPVALARAVEERGLDSLYFPEHTHIPTSRATPFPGGGDLPEWYSHTHDPFVALAAAAAVTERIQLGTGICLVTQRDPIILAKECASLDMISNGRLVLGFGAGWNREEMENHGANYPKRWAVAREKVLAMKAIWTEDEAEFHGEWVNFDPIWSYPKPVQASGPPVWLGASSNWVFDRVAEYAEGWMPIGGLRPGDMDRMREALAARNRKVEDLDLTLFAAPMKAEQLRGHIEQGFDHLIFSLPSEPEEKLLPLLDNCVALAEKLKAG